MLGVLMVASLVIGVDANKPGVFIIRTRNASGHLPLKSTADPLLPCCPDAAIVASLGCGSRRPLRHVLLITKGNRHTNVLNLEKKIFCQLFHVIMMRNRGCLAVRRYEVICRNAKRKEEQKSLMPGEQGGRQCEQNRMAGGITCVGQS
jgi:hypothetical protein